MLWFHQNRAEARVAAAKIRQLQEEQKELKGLVEKRSLENRQLEDGLNQVNEELEKRAKQRQHMRHQYEALGLAVIV
jgi:predicted RNase H-like nuclease (RuvC/YqgF family)